MWKFLKNNDKGIFVFLCLCLAMMSIYFHFYELTTRLHFAGDEADMSLAIRNIFVLHTFPLLGPSASLGMNIFHGAFFYYLYLVPGILSGFTPLGFGIFTAILSIASVFILLFGLKKLFGNVFALIVSFIYAVSFNVNFYGKWEWNPNTIPFFTILSIFALVQVIKGKKYYLLLFAFATAAITQLHLTGYMFIPIVICMIPILFTFVKEVKVWGLSVIAFLVPWIPTIIHEFKYHFSMMKALIKVFLHPSHVPFFEHINKGQDTFFFLFNRFSMLDRNILIVCTLAGIGWLIYYIYKQKLTEKGIFSLYLLLIIIFSFLMYAFYPGIVYIHYGEQLFPVFAILIGLALHVFLIRKQSVILAFAVLIVIAQLNLTAFINEKVYGFRLYEREKEICTIVKDSGKKQVKVIVNGNEDPNYVSYVCDSLDGIHLSSTKTAETFIFSTDFVNKFTYSSQ